MSDLTIIRGVPGSGKSTLARTLKENMEDRMGLTVFHFEADRFFTNLAGDYKFDASRLKEAHELCRLQALKAMCNEPDATIIVSNTFIRMWEMQPYLQLAKDFKRDIKIIELKTRYNSIHGVPQAKVDQMAESFYRLRPEISPEYFGGMTAHEAETAESRILTFTNT